MKAKWTVLWFLVSVALAAVLALQWKRTAQQRAKLESLQLQMEELAQQTRAGEAEVEELKKERLQLRSEVLVSQGELNNLRSAQKQAGQSAAAAAPGSSPVAQDRPNAGGRGNFLANMLENPEMREAMQNQQRLGLSMLYGPLLKQLQLTPDEEKKFFDLLLSQQMDNMSQAGKLFASTNNRPEAARQLAEQNKERQEQVKQLLGEERYARYEEYNQTAGERMMLQQLGQQIEITPEQNEQLLAIIREEKKNMQINTGAKPADPQNNIDFIMGTEEGRERFFAQQEQVNARVLERAGQVLTPEQVRQLEPVLKSQVEMQRTGAKMARQMFGGENSAAPE